MQNSCWSWCKDNNTLAALSAEADGQWCYLESKTCKTDDDCKNAPVAKCGSKNPAKTPAFDLNNFIAFILSPSRLTELIILANSMNLFRRFTVNL